MTSTKPGDPAPDTTAADGTQPGTHPLTLTHSQMNAAYDIGEAIPLASAVTWLTRYHGAWWVVYERGWLRITDTATTQDINQAAARLKTAQNVAATANPSPGTLTPQSHPAAEITGTPADEPVNRAPGSERSGSP